MSGTRVFLLRHAETAAPQVFHGAESDVGLSTKGHRQAELIAETLALFRPEVIVSSAMRRAHDTAAKIAQTCSVPHLVEPLLHERIVGSLSGVPLAGNAIWTETAQRWSSGQTDWANPGAESYDDIRRRVMPVWKRVVEAHRHKTIVVVAHGKVCKVLLLTLFPTWTWTGLGSIRNVGLTELHLNDGQWRAERINEWPTAISDLEFAEAVPTKLGHTLPSPK